jgi:hypothetical protein
LFIGSVQGTASHPCRPARNLFCRPPAKVVEFAPFFCSWRECTLTMHEMIIHQFMEEKNMSILKALLQLQAYLEVHRLGKKKSKPRQRLEGNVMLYNDYFSNDSTYNGKDFHRRYRMNWELFKKIVHVVRAYDDYFCVEGGLHQYGWFIVI